MPYYENDSHHQNKKKKSLYFILLLVTFVAIAALFLDIRENSGEFCSSCHTMRPEYHTWKVSSHNRRQCMDCHGGEGLTGLKDLSFDLARMAYSQVTGSYVRPIRLFRSIDDKACFRCHSYKRQASVSGDLIIPHQDHTSSRVRCVSCHSGVAHGDIARRNITRQIDFKDWDTDEGLQQMARELVQPSMDACMSCHYRRKITTECSACHTDMYGPDNHSLPDFDSQHGPLARTELSDCNTCHGYVGAKKLRIEEKTDFIKYTRDNTFCISCHRTRPESHEGDSFKDRHGKAITSGEKEKGSCLVCHDNNLADIPMVTDVTCSSCHPARHGKNWRQGHLPPVAPERKISYTCFTCHSTTTCLSCHYLPGYSDERTPLPDWQRGEGLPAEFFM